jgi:2-aminoadipate transaminase
MNNLLRTRRDAMLAALERHFGDSASWSRPEGGYFNWLDLPEGVDAGELLARATEAGVTYCKGTDFYPDGRGAGSLRLAYSFPSPDEIERGIAILAELAGEMKNNA